MRPLALSAIWGTAISAANIIGALSGGWIRRIAGKKGHFVGCEITSMRADRIAFYWLAPRVEQNVGLHYP